ncbi:MAG TPA: sodium:alanine symporter family protein [Rhabdochlamydiaceae bacterium]|nr:sodium:alanine symporter family protein [Rhabdochlamydiaceae bacterium]
MTGFNDSCAKCLNAIDEVLWGKCLILLLVGVGLFLTFRLKGMQFRYLAYSLKLAFTRQDHEAEGDISHFQSLMTALAATIGIGSIAGVATAIVAGGFGAIFWMWVIALIGMVTKFAEAILAVKYRIVDKRGQMCGGPMYYISQGLGWKWLAVTFAVFGSLSAFVGGNMTQSNSIAAALTDLVHVPPLWTGIVLTIMTSIVLLGGIRSIGKVSSYLVPVMALMYIGGGLVILFLRFDRIPESLYMIVKTAFTGQAAFGGFLGASMMAAVQLGVARGVSSNEAGLGSAPIAAAAAKTDVPGRQALVSMTGVFLSSLVVCTITALVISVTDVLGTTDAHGIALNGATLVMHAFQSVIPGGGAIVALGLVLFGYSTIVGWAYYGEKCMEFLAGEKVLIIYRAIFCAIVLLGALISFDIVWPLVDIMNGLMAFPNLIAIFALSGVVVAEAHSFFALVRSERLSKA